MKRILFCIILLFPIYIFSQVQFTQLGQEIDGEAASDASGRSVSMNAAGDRVAIGASNNDDIGADAGHVRIYAWNGTTWTQQGQDIDGEAAGDGSGWSVSMNASGDRVAIGSRLNDGNGTAAGHVRIYEWDGASWTQLGQDIDGEAAGDYSGCSVSMNASGDRVTIGATGNYGNGSGAGHVRIYAWNGNSWTQLGQDIDGEAAGDYSGCSVSMNATGDRVAIGAYDNDGNGNNAGHVRIYAWNGTLWTQLGQDIDGEAADDYSGMSVSINAAGDRVAIGARHNGGNGTDAGHVRVYDWNGTTWTQLGQDIDGEAAGDYSGCSVSMNATGDRVANGAWGNDGNGSLAGHVRIYDWNGTSWIQQGQDIDGEAAGDLSGYSVSMNATGDRVAIGALNGGNGSYSGHVRIYFQCNTILHTQNLSACDSYTWIDGNTYTSSTNTPTYTLNNFYGCDSVVTLELTILNSSSSTFNHIACDSYTWIDGNTYTSSTNTPTYTLTNAAGCDSTITLDLNILNSTTSTMTQVNCGAYVLNGIQYDISGQYQQVTSNSVGCDSIVNLNLTINTDTFNIGFNANQQAYLNPPFMVQFNNNTPNQSQYDYTWNFGDGNTLQSQNPVVSHEYQYNGLYDVTLYANDQTTGCTDSLYQHEFIYCAGGVDNPNGVVEQHAGDVTIYPNPTADYITLEVKHYQGPMEVTLFDMNGKILISQTTTKINLENLPSGAYQMVVKYGEKQQGVRVLKN